MYTYQNICDVIILIIIEMELPYAWNGWTSNL